MYLAVAVVGNGGKLLDATKGLYLYMIRTHAKSHELVRDIVSTILAETLVEICRAGGTVSSTDDTDCHVALLGQLHYLREIIELAPVGEVVRFDLEIADVRDSQT